MEDWNAVAAEVADALKEVGGTVVIRRKVLSGPADNRVTSVTNYNVTLVQMAIDYTNVTGTLIQMGDKAGMINAAGLAIVPTTADKLVIDGVEHALASVQRMQPDPNGAILGYNVIYRA